jgi:hypothetical protein
MKLLPLKFILLLFLLFYAGCNWPRFRPAGVPSSAVRVDDVFIDCSVDTHAGADHCTVYSANNGEVLADGLFRLINSFAFVDAAGLRYAAYGHRIIYLQDARILMLWNAGKRDPGGDIFLRRLKILASAGSTSPTDCGKTAGSESINDCINDAIAHKKPFYAIFPQREQWAYTVGGVVGDADGNVYLAFNRGASLPGQREWLPPEAMLFDDRRVMIMRCIYQPLYSDWEKRPEPCYTSPSLAVFE